MTKRIKKLNPMPTQKSASNIFFIHNSQGASTTQASSSYEIFPSAYLKSSVKILPNDQAETYGSIDNPFIVS